MTRKGGRERFKRVRRRNTLLERTTHVSPLVVDNQNHKSLKGSLPQLFEGTIEERQPYKLLVSKLEHGHNDKLLDGWGRSES